MNEQRFETGKTPQVTVSACAGTLTVGSWAGTAVLVKGPDFSGDAPELDQVTLSSAGNLTLTVPEKAGLSVEMVQGALTVKHVDGAIHIGAADGAVTLRDVGDVKIEMVNGRFLAENINAPLTVIKARQDVTLRNTADVSIKKAAESVAVQFANGAVLLEQMEGAVTLHTISGDVIVRQAGQANLSNLGGKNEVGGVKGILRLAGGLADGEHHFQANGNIYVAWPPDGPVTLIAKAALIDNQLPLSAATETADSNQTTLTGHIENGKPFVSLKTPAHIGLKPLRHGEKAALTEADFDFTPPPPTLAKIVTTAVRQHLPDATPDQIEQIVTAIKADLSIHHLRVETAAETATTSVAIPPPPSTGKIAAEKAQRKAEKSLRKARDTMAQVEAKLTQPTPEPKPETTSVATPSQTQILQLLQDGRITLEQANALLNQLS